jgi:hypothetical protein
MRDDFVPPAISTENKLGAAQHQLDRFRACIHRWNEKAKAMGYEGVDEALDKMAAMKRGPRLIETENCVCRGSGIIRVDGMAENCPLCNPSSAEALQK